MLLAAGDLTFNGEKLSHETVAGLFEEIEAAGVPVLTLPGNHDVNNGMAYCYTGNTAEPTETVTAQEFWEIYRAYGWEDKSAAGYRVDELCLGAGGGSLDHRH